MLAPLGQVDEDLASRVSLETPVLRGRGGKAKPDRGEADLHFAGERGGGGSGDDWVSRMKRSVQGGGDVGGEIIDGIQGGRGKELLVRGEGMKLLAMLAKSRPSSAAAALSLLCKVT